MKNKYKNNINKKDTNKKDKIDYRVNSSRIEKNKKQRYDIAKKEHIENTVNVTKIVVKIFMVLSIVLSIIYISCRYIGNMGLVVKEYAIDYERLPESFYGLKIVQISDVNYNDKTMTMNKIKILIDKVNSLRPDIIVFTGDLIYDDITQDELNQLEDYFSNLEAKIGKYAVFGNDDDTARILIKNAGFMDIENNYDLIYNDNYDAIMINGISQDSPNIMHAYSFLENNQDNIFTISLIHQPDTVTDILSHYSVDLVLAGHSLGGQINIPGIGGLFKIDGANEYINDYYQINNTDLYVSSGLGTRKYPYRFLNHPSISLFRLK